MSLPLANPVLRAVVVDDTPDLRALLCLALESSGEIEVVGEAGNGLDGVEQVRLNRPDIVLLDLAMPVMDGLEALPRMRELCPEATIVVLSGFGASAMANRALAAGADGYLQKGASAGAILDYVRSLVGYAPTGLRLIRPPAPPPAVPREAAEVALDLAPFGVLVLRDAPTLPVTAANPRALALLGVSSLVGEALSTAVPELGVLVRRMAATVDAADEFVVIPPRRPVAVTLRRTGEQFIVYLDHYAEAGGGEMLRRAIATTAHEIRTPVTVLVGVADTLNERGDELTPETRHRLRASVLRQAKLLDSMTADLLTAAQAHRGTLNVDLDRVDVRALVAAVLEGRDEDVVVEVEEGLDLVADPVRLEQMVTNLLGNARKYGTAPFLVRAGREGDEALLEVVDHGPGVPVEFEPVLFDEFTRAPGTSARGTGLGLYVVRSLAEAHGGGVAYRRDGEATVFSVRLPIAGD